MLSFLKSMYEIILLPFTMKFVAWIKNREGIDIIDYPEDTKYTPFKL